MDILHNFLKIKSLLISDVNRELDDFIKGLKPLDTIWILKNI